jgi:hypothetical protein
MHLPSRTVGEVATKIDGIAKGEGHHVSSPEEWGKQERRRTLDGGCRFTTPDAKACQRPSLLFGRMQRAAGRR